MLKTAGGILIAAAVIVGAHEMWAVYMFRQDCWREARNSVVETELFNTESKRLNAISERTNAEHKAMGGYLSTLTAPTVGFRVVESQQILFERELSTERNRHSWFQ